MLVALMALLAAQEAPPALTLKAGTIAYDRRMEISISGEGVKGKADQRISMDAGYSFDVKPADEGYVLQMKVSRAKLENAATGRPIDTWALPDDKPIEARVRVDAAGRMTEPSLMAAGFQAAGAARLRKIPLVYFWSQNVTAMGVGGPFASGPGLPPRPAAEWTYVDEHSYGLGGLLDDFSRVRETWKAVVKKAEGGVLECELTLESVELAETQRNVTISLTEAKGKGTCRIDAATGLTLSAELEHGFSYTGVSKKGAEAKVSLKRVEKLEKK